MKTKLLDILVCPACLPGEHALTLENSSGDDSEIIEGDLVCKQCGQSYPVRDGIADIVPEKTRQAFSASPRYEDPGYVSAYLWSHYADLFNDPDASDAYSSWASHLAGPGEFGLDTGCAVGRFTLEMSKHCELAIGVDVSPAFIALARKLLVERKLSFPLTVEGSITIDRTITLPEDRDSDRAEFIIADVLSLPFRRSSFSAVSSLNIIDKVPRPRKHLEECSRVALEKHARFVFSDPFSWSTECAPEDQWLGGTERLGKGIDRVQELLSGDCDGFRPCWSIDAKGQVWWKIRNHANHFELIRSRYLVAAR